MIQCVHSNQYEGNEHGGPCTSSPSSAGEPFPPLCSCCDAFDFDFDFEAEHEETLEMVDSVLSPPIDAKRPSWPGKENIPPPPATAKRQMLAYVGDELVSDDEDDDLEMGCWFMRKGRNARFTQQR